MKLIGIGGGSGAGKSAVSYALVDVMPEIFEVINLDDYHRLDTEKNLPLLHGMINWDHPAILNWQSLRNDLAALKKGKTITIQTWAHRSNPDYKNTHRRILRHIKPKPIIILEGYLALYNTDLIKLLDKSYYFDLDEQNRNMRRDKNTIIDNPDYAQKVLAPMHAKYVEPTKNNADVVIDVSQMTVEQIKHKILSDLRLV